MPLIQHTLTPISTIHYARAVNPSEAAALQGKPAKTPIIAGSVCGGVLIIAWLIGFAIYFRKRYRRKKRKRAAIAAGMPPPEVKSKPQEEEVVIPPDPAVFLGQRSPGYAFAAANATGKNGDKGKGRSEGEAWSQSPENRRVEDGGGSDDRHMGRPSLSATANMPDVSNLGVYQPINTTE